MTSEIMKIRFEEDALYAFLLGFAIIPVPLFVIGGLLLRKYDKDRKKLKNQGISPQLDELSTNSQFEKPILLRKTMIKDGILTSVQSKYYPITVR